MWWIAQQVTPSGGGAEPWQNLLNYGVLGIIALCAILGGRAVYKKINDEKDQWVQAYMKMSGDVNDLYVPATERMSAALKSATEVQLRSQALLERYEARLEALENRPRPRPRGGQ